MKRATLYLTLVSIFATASFAQTNLDPGKASGQLIVDGNVTKLNHAYARIHYDFFDAKKNLTSLIFAEAPVPDDAVDVIGITDAQKLKAAGTRYVVEYQITGEGSESSILIIRDLRALSSNSSYVRPTMLGNPKIELLKNDDRFVEGRLYIAEPEKREGHTYELNVAFHLPVKSDAARAPVRAKDGVKLPVGGGAPGAAFLKFQKALEAAKTAREMAGVLLVSLTARLVEETKPSPNAGPVPKEVEELAFQLMRVNLIERPQVTGGFISGDKATIAVVGFQKTMDAAETAKTEKISARFNMHLENGQWKRGYGSMRLTNNR